MSETIAIVKENLRMFGLYADVKVQTLRHLCRIISKRECFGF